MSYTQMMTNQDPDEQVINQDNKQYRFKPGKEGYLVAPAKPKPTMEETLNMKLMKSKTVPSAVVGSARG